MVRRRVPGIYFASNMVWIWITSDLYVLGDLDLLVPHSLQANNVPFLIFIRGSLVKDSIRELDEVARVVRAARLCAGCRHV